MNTETAIQGILDLLFIQEKTGTGREDFLPVTQGLRSTDIKYVKKYTPFTLIKEIYILYFFTDPIQTLADYGLAVPAHEDNEVAIILEDILPMFAALSFIFIVPPLVKRLVHEKESGVKEFMRMMGLPLYINWIAWFLSALAMLLIINVIIVLLLTINFNVRP